MAILWPHLAPRALVQSPRRSSALEKRHCLVHIFDPLGVGKRVVINECLKGRSRVLVQWDNLGQFGKGDILFYTNNLQAWKFGRR